MVFCPCHPFHTKSAETKNGKSPVKILRNELGLGEAAIDTGPWGLPLRVAVDPADGGTLAPDRHVPRPHVHCHDHPDRRGCQ